MNRQSVLALFDYSYWATWSILAAVQRIPLSEFAAPPTITWRNVRDTLVHTLDVEQSWRRRIQGSDRSVWDAELTSDRYTTPAALEADWRKDAGEMRSWLLTLDDDAIDAIAGLGEGNRFPLWHVLVHIVTHSIEQRRDVALQLRDLGHEPPQLEFLWYSDALAERS